MALAIFVASPLGAQSGLGRITGTITDSAGLSVPGTGVAARETRTGQVFQATSSDTGVYVVTSLPLGTYTLELKKDGFKTVSRSGLNIDVNTTLTVDVALEPGSVTERITVEATAGIIQTESASIGNSRYEVQLKNLPVMVREIQTLVGQTAGVPMGSTDVMGGTFNQGGRSAMQVGSDGASVSSFQTTAWPAIDGIGRRADLSMPSIDAIAEVKFVSGGANAEFSQPTQVIVATKSGTNEFHGSAFEFYRSGGMGARRWEDAVRTSFVRHQFGGTLAGPIKRDKSFFLTSADVFRHAATQSTNVRYPTEAERIGNLSTYQLRVDAAGRPAPVTPLDPLNGGQPFPNFTIPASRISPVSAELLKSIPAAPQPGGRISDFNANYFKPLKDNSEKYDLRWDHYFSGADRFFTKGTIARLDQASRYRGDVPGSIGASAKRQWNQTAGATWTRTLNPTSILNLQFTWRNLPFKNTPTGGDTKFPVAIRDVNPEAPFAGPPAIAIGNNAVGIGVLFDRLLFNYSAEYNWALEPTYTKTIGSHTIKTGTSSLKGWKTTELASPPYGRFTTASDFNNSRSTSSASGDAYADFLLGYPSSTDVTIGEYGAFQTKQNFSAFLQDDWKVTQRLTLNYGIRYDYFGYWSEINGRQAVSDMQTGKILIPDGSLSKVHPVFQQFSASYIEAGARGLPNTFIAPNRLDFTPRLGFAYRVTDTFVLRGAAGIYNVDNTINQFQGEVNVAPFVRRANLARSQLLSQNVDVNRVYTFQNPTADSSTAGANTQLTTLDGFFPRYPTMKMNTWNVTMEKQLGRLIGVRASYAGNMGRNLSRQVRVNSCVAGPTECLARTVNDPSGRKWTQFGIDAGQRAGDGTSNYQALELEITRRFSGGLFLNANYAYAKTLRLEPTASDPIGNPQGRYDWGPVAGQPPHVFHFNYVYDLPFGPGRRYLTGKDAASWLLREWSISGLSSWQDGSFLTITAPNGQSPTGAAPNRADRLKDGRFDQGGRSRHEKAYQWFDPTAFAQPAFLNPAAARPTRQFGSAASGAILGPRFFNYDMTISRAIRIAETYRLQFRAEIFNPINVPMLGNPDTSVVSPVFSQIRTSNVNYTPRNLQLGLRLDF
ncbi:MAG: carboxypeptidase regulatory-like domain-containing protein [Acidobacteriota bacterium]